MLFKNLTDFMNSVRKTAVLKEADRRLTPVNYSGMGSSGPAFQIPETLQKTLLEKVFKTTHLAQYCTIVPAVEGVSSQIIAPKVDEQYRLDGCRYGGVSAAWIPEGGTIPESNVAFGAVSVTLKKLASAVRTSTELFEDFPGIDKWLMNVVGEEIAFTLDNAIFSGNGIAEPLGIINSDACIKVEKESGQPSGTIVLDNVLNMIERFDVRSWNNSAWYCNLACLKQLMKMRVEVGTGGGPIFSFDAMTLAGRPIIPIEHSPVPGQVGDLILADVKQYCLASRNIGAAMSIHVYFTTAENSFRFILQANGSPIWGSPITPLHGNSTVSPFVAIAERA